MFVYTVSLSLGGHKQTNYGLPHILRVHTVVNIVDFPGKHMDTIMFLS